MKEVDEGQGDPAPQDGKRDRLGPKVWVWNKASAADFLFDHLHCG
jgi:hypothetical protein